MTIEELRTLREAFPPDAWKFILSARLAAIARAEHLTPEAFVAKYWPKDAA